MNAQVDAILSSIAYYYDFFAIDNKSILTVMYTYIGIAIFGVAVRMFMSQGYQTQYHLFSRSIKAFKFKTDIVDTRSKLLNNAIKEYVIAGERGVSHIDTRAIVHKYLNRLHFFGWGLKSMESFVHGFENSLMAIGVLFALLQTTYTLQWSVLAVLVYVVTRILISVFDYALVKEKLLDEMTIYIDREVGQFFQSDLAASVNSFKIEMKTILEMQTKMIGDAVMKAGTDLSGAVIVTVKESNKNIEDTLKTITGQMHIVNEPIENWKSAIKETDALQKSLNKTYQSISGSFIGVEKSMNAVIRVIGEHSGEMAENKEMVMKQLETLAQLTKNLSVNNMDIELKNKIMEEQLVYLERNQTLLNESIGQYEETFEDVTSKLGDALGRIVDYSLKNAYGEIAENINNDIGKLTNASNELIMRIGELFDNFADQRRNETSAIMNMKDQMDIHFEQMKRTDKESGA